MFEQYIFIFIIEIEIENKFLKCYFKNVIYIL